MRSDSTRARYESQQLGEVRVFYREAGPAHAPAILLLHGFPTASHMFRDLIPLLAHRYRLAPAGAEDYMPDNPAAEVHLLDAGHFALGTHAGDVAALILDFLPRAFGDQRTGPIQETSYQLKA